MHDKKQKMKLICITPIFHIDGFKEKLEKFYETDFDENIECSKNLLMKCNDEKYSIIFTNPNQQKFILDKHSIGKNIKFICTASTGLNHIDVQYCKANNIKVISITHDIETLKNITSTAELAMCLTLMSIRKVITASESARKGNWSWQPYVGRQIKNLTIGVVGYGRLGKMYADYAASFGSNVIVFDPYVSQTKYEQAATLENLFTSCDVVSLHVHVNDSTKYMINERILSFAKKDLILINTSRGEIVNENDVLKSLSNNKIHHYACDVLENEFQSKVDSVLFKLPKEKFTVTPHIGGCSIDAQKIAYNRALDLLIGETT